MVQYLSGTGEKMDGVIKAAIGRGADGEKVRIVSLRRFFAFRVERRDETTEGERRRES